MRFETNVSLNMAGRLSIRGRECFPSGLTIFFFCQRFFSFISQNRVIEEHSLKNTHIALATAKHNAAH